MDKWQQVSAIVTQSVVTPPNNFQQKYKKLIITRLVSENILTLILQYIGLMLSTLAFTNVPIWFATGTACAMIFSRGYSILPGIFLGSFIAYITTHASISLAFGCASLFALQAFLLFEISCRFIGPSIIFYKIKIFLRFILYSSILSTLISLGLILISYPYLTTPIPFLQLWINWTLADLNGILVFSVAIVTVDVYFSQIAMLSKLNVIKLSAYFALLFVIMIIFLLTQNTFVIPSLSLTIISVIGLIGIHYGWCGAVASACLCGIMLSLAANIGAPIFLLTPSWVPLIWIPAFLVIFTIVGLFVATKFHQLLIK